MEDNIKRPLEHCPTNAGLVLIDSLFAHPPLSPRLLSSS
jgi:hypothetical protein